MTTLPFNDPNGRIFYACQAVLTTKRNMSGESPATDGVFLNGVQSIGINGDMPSQSLLDIGRAQRQFHYYGQQNFEITIERRIDKDSDFFYFVDPSDYTAGAAGYKSSHVLYKNNLHDKGFADSDGKSLRNYDITILYAPDKYRYIGSENDVTPSSSDSDKDKIISVTYKSCLLSSVEYNIGVDGITESVTLFTKQFRFNKDLSTLSDYGINNDLPQVGEVLKRSHLDILKQPVDRKSRLPQEVISMFELGDTESVYDGDDGAKRPLKIYGINNINLSLSIDYSQIPDVGFWRGSEKDKEYEQNLFSYMNLPLQVSCSFTGVARRALEYGDFIWTDTADDVFVRNTDVPFAASGVMDKTTGLSYGGGPYRDGLDPNNPDPPKYGSPKPPSDVYNKTDRPIRLVFATFDSAANANKYHIIDLGNNNYVTSIATTGGDTGGGNVETTITYQNDHSDMVLVKDTQVRDLINEKPF
tara:strand:+ start:53 stop:1468 length:1416 start_codon:yes stop_codon:yes gene_type:complete